MRLYFSVDANDYTSDDLTALSTEILNGLAKKVVVQRLPDTRIHVLLNDGTVALFMQDPLEPVGAWIPITTDGTILDMVVLPGQEEDRVYYAVARTNGVFLEKWALESECQGGAINKLADSFVVYDGSATTDPFTTELLHLTGETVTIWADGVYVGTDTVDGSGALTNSLATAAAQVVVGLTYRAQFKSVKLGSLTGKKSIPQVSLLMRNVHASGIQIGQDFTNMVGIPKADFPLSGGDPDTDHVFDDYHMEAIPIDSKWDYDARLCLQIDAPYPATVLAAVLDMNENEK